MLVEAFVELTRNDPKVICENSETFLSPLQTLTTINVDFSSYSGYIQLQTVLSFNSANALLSSSTGGTSTSIARNPIDSGRLIYSRYEQH